MMNGTLNWILPTMKFHEGILFRHVHPHCFVVYAIFEVLVPGCPTVKSLEAVQAEVLSFLMITIATREYSTQVRDCKIVPLPFSNYEEQIGHSPLVLGLS